MVAHAFNPSAQEAEAGGSLVYRTSSRTSRATQRDPVSKKSKNLFQKDKKPKPTKGGNSLHTVILPRYTAWARQLPRARPLLYLTTMRYVFLCLCQQGYTS